jgi:glycosyltransferase involved in cell wall biosynthesis
VISSDLTNKKPLVSVIIPTYNHAHYLCEAVDSVLSQDYDDYEIIVVDDGSTDNTGQVLASYGSKVRCIYQRNQGLATARNTGIKAARGEYIALLDADDLYKPDYISTLTSIMSSNPHAHAIHCASRFVDKNNKTLPQTAGRIVTPDTLYPTLLHGNFIPPLCMFVSSKCYKNLGYFDTNLPVVEDWDLWLRLAREYCVISTSKILARYRVVHNSMSTNIERMLKYKLDVLEKNFGKGLEDKAQLSDFEREAYSRTYLTAAVEYLQISEPKNAYSCFVRAFDIFPHLINSLDIINEIFWGSVQRGYRGCLDYINIKENSSVLFNILGELVRDPKIDPIFKTLYKKACGNAYLVISQNNYKAGNYHEIRRHWIAALNISPGVAFSKMYLFLLIKSYMDKKLLKTMKMWKQV